MAKKFDFKRIGMKVAGVGAGAVVGRVADKPLANMNPKLRAALKIGVGAVLPELAPKSPFIENMGSGVLAVGAADLFDNLTNKTVSGLGEAYDMALGASDYDTTEVGDVSGEENALAGIGDDETYV